MRDQGGRGHVLLICTFFTSPLEYYQTLTTAPTLSSIIIIANGRIYVYVFTITGHLHAYVYLITKHREYVCGPIMHIYISQI
jgi:hypothetical protein